MDFKSFFSIVEIVVIVLTGEKVVRRHLAVKILGLVYLLVLIIFNSIYTRAHVPSGRSAVRTRLNARRGDRLET